MGTFLLLTVLISFIISYFTYGKWIRKKLKISDDNETPAHTLNDGVDYVPSRKEILFGHHFASIAGVGPIVGPILGATFGWVPVFLWILFGNIFLGAVHDFTSLVASIRHKGKTIGSILLEYLGQGGKITFLIFTWFALVLVIAVFDIVISKTFVSHPEVATTSFIFIIIAIFFGYFIYVKKTPVFLTTLIGILFLFIGIYIGNKFPIKLSYNLWIIILLLYVFIASITPVWILLQPRDYLNSFLLYLILIGGVIGVFLYHPSIKLEAYKGFFDKKIGLLFPMLFVTVACGAISGFHSLVSSGTTSKQIDKETDAQFIGYGGMLVEGVLAIIALLTAIMLTRNEYTKILLEKGAVSLFSTGLGSFLVKLHIPFSIGVSFAALAISAFALTTLDTSTRLGRYTFQELFEDSKIEILNDKYFATFITVLGGAILAFDKGGTMAIWPLFGAANQMLASLALLTVTLFLTHQSMNNKFVKIPAVFMFIVTISAIIFLIINNLKKGNIPLIIVAFILLITSIGLLLLTYNKTLMRNK